MQDLERFIPAFDPAQTIRLQDRLQQLTIPTAIVWGTGDIFFDERWSHWLADTVPGTRSRTSLEGTRLLFPACQCWSPGSLRRMRLESCTRVGWPECARGHSAGR